MKHLLPFILAAAACALRTPLRAADPAEAKTALIASPADLKARIPKQLHITKPDYVVFVPEVTDTNVNVMVVPGQVSKLTYTFDTVGEFPYLCHEYCGRGHATMFGVVNVFDPDEDSDPDETSGEDGE